LPTIGGFVALMTMWQPFTAEPIDREEYAYVAHAHGHAATADSDRIAMIVERFGEETRLSLVTHSKESEERIAVSLRPPGELSHAVREVFEDGALGKRQVVRRVGRRVQIESYEDGRVERNAIALPTAPLAVDASLLLLLRPFVESDETSRRVFMVDFSGRNITVELRKRGLEDVAVPAGRFRCHKVEVVVRFLVFKAVIRYWLAAKAPHFLVKHVGKRGPFSRTTVTELTERSAP